MTSGAAGAPPGGLPVLPPVFNLIALDSVGSTNDEARRLAEEGAAHGTIVWAGEQTTGRGRQGRSWTSPRGNLYLSLVLRPECALSEAAQVSFVACVALGEAVAALAGKQVVVTYKWPNDVMFNAKKGAGVLLESKSTPAGGLDWLILGMGTNIEHFPDDARYPASSLRKEGADTTLVPAILLEELARQLDIWLEIWRNRGFRDIRAAWKERAQGLGKPIEVRLPKETLTGVFGDLDGDGALLLKNADGGTRTITAGDVFPGA
ncbi:biotin--[acetyl-CoA-carboxylase] ligase [Pelagibius sp. Alg239-R121]|uniref:biotin--[acetyl-CoA-carboxylase] ligase n=1 Tax=Pelagibius sp. Alg239-R121 TaxID=2993448 RepID=UPI0024A6E466|nr:biotin--[acetyl-CoA-carboxylase] ligase [Pelagibius sp. Alg239-R121]